MKRRQRWILVVLNVMCLGCPLGIGVCLAVSQVINFYAFIPGGTIGLLFMFSGFPKPFWTRTFCGFMGLFSGIFAEWAFAPLREDSSFWYFLRHLNALSATSLSTLGIGGILAAGMPSFPAPKDDDAASVVPGET